MSKTRINYKSDLPPITVTFMVNGQDVSVPSNDFVLRFFVDGAPGVSYECSYNAKSGEYINCEKTDDDTLVCYIDNHKFGCGRLCVEFIDLSENIKYRDGVQKTVTPSKLNIVLVEGMGDAAPEVEASVIVDLTTLISEARTLIEGLEGYETTINGLIADIGTIEGELQNKLDYYDVGWIETSSLYSETRFNELASAIAARKLIIYKNNIAHASKTSNHIRVVVSYYSGFREANVWLNDGVVTVEWSNMVYFAEGSDVSSLDARLESVEGDITTLEGNITGLGGRVTSVEEWQTQAGNAASLPHYHSANWLENEQGSYSEDFPERRLKVRYTAMMSAINDNRLIKLFNVTASGVSINDGVISAVFMTTNSNGTSQTVRYYVRYASGDDYCTVEKKEIPMPYYDATWATTYGGSLENLEEFINVINSTPRALMLVESQPVVWAARRTPYMVQFAVMIDGGMRTYTTQYDSDAGETYCSYEDTIFQST